jgi:hypothetical protein
MSGLMRVENIQMFLNDVNVPKSAVGANQCSCIKVIIYQNFKFDP